MSPLASSNSRATIALWAITGIVAALCVAFLALPLSALYYLNRGMDISDTGHYYVSIYHLADVKMMSTQFALVWKLLPLPDNIYINRLAVFTLLTGSGAALFVQAGRAVLPLPGLPSPGVRWSGLPLQHYCLACLGAGGSAVYYYYWLPDPSYNSIGLILMALVLGAVFTLVQQTETRKWQFRSAAMLAGFAGIGLIATRPVTALAVAVVSAALFMLLTPCHKQKTAGHVNVGQRLLPLIIFTLLGGLLFFVAVQLFIEPIHITLERLQGGLQKREILGIRRLVQKSLALFSDEISSALKLAPMALILAIIGGVLAAPGISMRLTKLQNADILARIGALVGGAGLVWMQTVFWQQTHALSDVTLQHIAIMMFNLGLIALLIPAIAWVLSIKPELRRQYFRLALVCTLLMLVTLSFSVFGTGLWLRKAGIAGVFIVLACGLSALYLAKNSGQLWSLAMASALALTMFGVRTHMIHAPYRQDTPLSAQKTPTSLRGGHSEIRTDLITKTFFDQLSAAASQISALEKPPILIDLSGRMPMVQYHLNARPAYTAWLLSGYEGSDAFLAHLVARMSDDELARAWILDAPGYTRRLDPSPLIARGIDMQNHYRVATTAFAPYIKQDVVLLAPRFAPDINEQME